MKLCICCIANRRGCRSLLDIHQIRTSRVWISICILICFILFDALCVHGTVLYKNILLYARRGNAMRKKFKFLCTRNVVCALHVSCLTKIIPEHWFSSCKFSSRFSFFEKLFELRKLLKSVVACVGASHNVEWCKFCLPEEFSTLREWFHSNQTFMLLREFTVLSNRFVQIWSTSRIMQLSR